MKQPSRETALANNPVQIAVAKEFATEGIAICMYYDDGQKDALRAWASVREFDETPHVREYPQDIEPGDMHGYYLSSVEASYAHGSQHLQDVSITRNEMLAVKRFLGLRRDLLKLPGSKGMDWWPLRTPSTEKCFNLIDTANMPEHQLMAGALEVLRNGEDAPRAELLESLLKLNFLPELDLGRLEAAVDVYRAKITPPAEPVAAPSPNKRRPAGARTSPLVPAGAARNAKRRKR